MAGTTGGMTTAEMVRFVVVLINMGAVYEVAVNGGIPVICVGAGIIASAVGLVNELVSYLTDSFDNQPSKGSS